MAVMAGDRPGGTPHSAAISWISPGCASACRAARKVAWDCATASWKPGSGAASTALDKICMSVLASHHGEEFHLCPGRHARALLGALGQVARKRLDDLGLYPGAPVVALQQRVQQRRLLGMAASAPGHVAHAHDAA